MSSESSPAVPRIVFDRVRKIYRVGSETASFREAFAGKLRFSGSGSTIRPREVVALDGVSFRLDCGRSLGIIGPNGSGKTTVLKLLSRITQPDAGTIKTAGRTAALIELGAGFHPDLSGRENLYLNAAILGMSRKNIDKLYPRIVEFSGLHKFMETPVKRYSSGMYVRLGFSVAAHVEPDILIVDEVLAVGDGVFQKKCLERILNLKKKGTAIVFVSHNMNLIRAVCDEALFLLEGRAQLKGLVVEVIRKYEEFLRQQEVKEIPSLNQTSRGLGTAGALVELVSVDTLNGAGMEESQFHSDETFRVRVRFEALRKIHRPAVLVRIIRSDGLTCCEIRSRNSEQWLQDLSGVGEFEFSLDPVQLASGAYLIEVCLNDESDIASLGSGRSDWFQVIGSGVTVSYEYGGVFEPNVRWEFETQGR